MQSRFNAGFDHYTITVPPPGGNYTEELDLHFIHQQSSRDDATPLLMLHEWPSTSLEWEKVIPGLANPGKYQPAFHVVAPDLPGFGFLPAPTEPGLGPQELAHVFPSLMQQLGYKRYAVYSTDLGFPVALFMVQNNAVEIINHIDDFYVVFPNADDLAAFAANQSTAEEVAIIAAVNDFNTNHAAYSAIHSTLPLSIAHSLNDSPVGFLAWIYQLVYTVSDKAYTTSELITQALLLYIPGVYGNIRSYEELCPVLGLLANGAIPKSAVPTSVLQFGGKTPYPPLDNFNFIVSTSHDSPFPFLGIFEKVDHRANLNNSPANGSSGLPTSHTSAAIRQEGISQRGASRSLC